MNHYDNDEITLYGVGISYMESKALSITFNRCLEESNAFMCELPVDNSDYYCYIYYTDPIRWALAHRLFLDNFAITSPKMYLRKYPKSDIPDGIDID